MTSFEDSILTICNYNYDYTDDQVLLNSKKITFNSKTENTTISSFQNTILGAGNELKIITNHSTTIESSNIYLGEQAKEEKEPLVLGNQLKIILDEMLGLIESLKMTGVCPNCLFTHALNAELSASVPYL